MDKNNKQEQQVLEETKKKTWVNWHEQPIAQCCRFIIHVHLLHNSQAWLQADPEKIPLVLQINFLSILTLNAEPKTVRQARMPSVTLPCLFVVVVVVAQATIGQVNDRSGVSVSQCAFIKNRKKKKSWNLPAHQIKHFFWHWAINFAVIISEIISICVLVHVGGRAVAYWMHIFAYWTCDEDMLEDLKIYSLACP